MLGCDYHCGYCQNWITSQALRDPLAESNPNTWRLKILSALPSSRCKGCYEYLQRTAHHKRMGNGNFLACKKSGLITSYVSNGNGTPRWSTTSAVRRSLIRLTWKGFRQKSYGQLGGVLQNVLDTIKWFMTGTSGLKLLTLIVARLQWFGRRTYGYRRAIWFPFRRTFHGMLQPSTRLIDDRPWEYKCWLHSFAPGRLVTSRIALCVYRK